ncbi:MAG: tetratricopeptide repeat protein [Planctomycetota bacterium]
MGSKVDGMAIGWALNLVRVLVGQEKHSEAESICFDLLGLDRTEKEYRQTDTIDFKEIYGWTPLEQGIYFEGETIYHQLREFLIPLADKHYSDNIRRIVYRMIAIHNRLLCEHGRFFDLERHYRLHMLGDRKHLGEEHEAILLQKHFRARTLLKLHRLSDAESSSREALESCLDVLGEEHPITLGLKTTLAMALVGQDRLSEAGLLINRTCESCRRVLGEEHPQTIESLNVLAHLLKKKGELAEAQALIRKVLDARKRVLYENALDTLISMHDLAQVLMDQDRLSEAEPLFKKTVEIARIVLSWDHLNRIIFQNNYADCLIELHKYEEAEAQLIASYEGSNTPYLGLPITLSQDVLNQMIGLYEAWGKPDKVLECRELLISEDGTAQQK